MQESFIYMLLNQTLGSFDKLLKVFHGARRIKENRSKFNYLDCF